MEPIDYRGALGRGWRLLVVLGLVGLLAGLLLAPSGKSSQWVTLTSVGALPPDTTSAGPLVSGVSTDQILFYATSDAVYAEAGRLAKINEPVSVLRAMTTVTGPSTTSSGSPTGQAGVVQVEVKAPSANESVNLNNAFDEAMQYAVVGVAVSQLQEQQTQISKSIATVQAQLYGTDPTGLTATALESELSTLETRQGQLAATTPYTGFTVLSGTTAAFKSSSPVTESRAVRGLFGLLIGVLLGAVVALAVSMLDKRLRTSRRAESAFGYPVAAEIPDPSIPSTEAYRMLWLSVFCEPLARPVAADDGWADATELVYDRLDLVPVVALANRGAHPVPVPTIDEALSPVARQVVLVASPGTEPTRGSVAAGLATACAESGQRVAVISTSEVTADRRGMQTDDQRPDHRATPITTLEVEAMLEGTRLPGVYTLPLDRLVPLPGQLVAVAPAVLSILRGMVDVVIVEVPPFLAVHHGEGLVPVVDVVLVVGEYRYTTSDQVRRMGAILRRLEAPVAGLALTNVPGPAVDPRRPSTSVSAVDKVDEVEPPEDGRAEEDSIGGYPVHDEEDQTPRRSEGGAAFIPPDPAVRPQGADGPDSRGI